MRITVKLFAYFRDGRFREEEREYPEQTLVQTIVTEVGIDPEEVGVLMLNSRHCSFDTVLKEGDALAIFPVIGGG